MAFNSLRLRASRALPLSASLSRHLLHRPQPISAAASLLPIPTPTASPASALAPNFPQFTRLFHSSSFLYRKTFDPETDEIGPDTILFEGCDYNHWLITVDFPKDGSLTREQMIETYVNIAAQVFGSVEEAKKKIYALSTTTYQGFQVLCSEEVSEKFKSVPGVVFVLPDSYIDPVNKEYGGDKYVNGEIFPRPPPVHYGRQNRDRRPRDQVPYKQGNAPYGNQGSPQQNYGPPPPQRYGPPPQQNYGPPPQRNYGPPPQQNYGPPLQQNYGPPPQQNYGPPPQQNYGPPPQQNYGPLPPPNYGPPPQPNGPPQGQSYEPRSHQGYKLPPQQDYEPPTERSHGNVSNFHPQQYSSRPPFSGERNQMPSHQGTSNQAQPGNHFTQGQRDLYQGNLESNMSPDQRGLSQDGDQGSAQGGGFNQVPGGQRNFSSQRNY